MLSGCDKKGIIDTLHRISDACVSPDIIICGVRLCSAAQAAAARVSHGDDGPDSPTELSGIIIFSGLIDWSGY